MPKRRNYSGHRLSPRDRRIVEHVVRHRITTHEVLHKLFFAGQQPNAVVKVTTRLCDTGHLRGFTLYHPRTYYRLGLQAAQQLGLPMHRTLPLGPQSLPTEYATLAYATLGSHYHRRLTTQELVELCPWLPRPLPEQPHCLDESGRQPRLEAIRVDLGGRPDHVARKCDADIQSRDHFQAFKSFLKQHRFGLVVVTGTTEKAAAIREALDEHVWPDGLEIHLAVVPDLPLLTWRLDHGS